MRLNLLALEQNILLLNVFDSKGYLSFLNGSRKLLAFYPRNLNRNINELFQNVM